MTRLSSRSSSAIFIVGHAQKAEREFRNNQLFLTT